MSERDREQTTSTKDRESGRVKRGPLAGIRVIDLGIHRAGPHCALLLARLGADVIKVEVVGGEEMRHHGPQWAQENNSKRSLEVNIRTAKGQQIIRELARRSDVIVQNFRPGVLSRVNLDFGDLRALNPRLICASVSGYGTKSSRRDLPGFDGIMQAFSGLMMLNGTTEMPPLKVRPPIVDRMAGLHAAIGVLAALYRRSVTGTGDCIDVSLCQSAYTIGDAEMAGALSSGIEPRRTGNRAAGPPVNNIFEAKDGWLYVATGGRQRMWEAICEMIGRPEWLTDPRLSTKHGRTTHSDLIESGLQTYFSKLSVDSALQECATRRIPAARVNTVLEAGRSDYVAERDILRQVNTPDGSMPVCGNLWHFTEADVVVGDGPGAGQHTREILDELALHTPEEVETLFAEGVVG
jgi:crotonobetainyl-CoA:carnitine CoA-transferase CaiB-like acyl-CoA transferase